LKATVSAKRAVGLRQLHSALSLLLSQLLSLLHHLYIAYGGRFFFRSLNWSDIIVK